MSYCQPQGHTGHFTGPTENSFKIIKIVKYLNFSDNRFSPAVFQKISLLRRASFRKAKPNIPLVRPDISWARNPIVVPSFFLFAVISVETNIKMLVTLLHWESALSSGKKKTQQKQFAESIHNQMQFLHISFTLSFEDLETLLDWTSSRLRSQCAWEQEL
jgi:hypothetical protein